VCGPQHAVSFSSFFFSFGPTFPTLGHKEKEKKEDSGIHTVGESTHCGNARVRNVHAFMRASALPRLGPSISSLVFVHVGPVCGKKRMRATRSRTCRTLAISQRFEKEEALTGQCQHDVTRTRGTRPLAQQLHYNAAGVLCSLFRSIVEL